MLAWITLSTCIDYNGASTPWSAPPPVLVSWWCGDAPEWPASLAGCRCATPAPDNHPSKPWLLAAGCPSPTMLNGPASANVAGVELRGVLWLQRQRYHLFWCRRDRTFWRWIPRSPDKHRGALRSTTWRHRQITSGTGSTDSCYGRQLHCGCQTAAAALP